MAIDPATLDSQRNALRIVARHESKCGRCGRRTTDRGGVCAACKRGHIPDLTLMHTEHVVGLIDACRAELKRRRDALDAALGEP